jgi:hypothetical protein
MSNQFVKTLTTDVGTTPETVYTTGATTRSTVIGINIANTTTGPIIVDIQFTDDANNNTGYVVKGVVIAKGTSLAAIGGDQKLVLEPEDSISVTSNVATSADVIVSALEITE